MCNGSPAYHNTCISLSTFNSDLTNMLRCSLSCLQSSLPSQRSQGDLHVQLIYKPYEDDEESHDAYKERESFAVARQEAAITDVKSAAGAQRSVQGAGAQPAVMQETSSGCLRHGDHVHDKSTCNCMRRWVSWSEGVAGLRSWHV